MTTENLYKSIRERTGGDIYIGVVGPVRSGKSTFIRNFIETMVIPNIQGGYMKERARDELPQASAGKTIMTTEPKFIPEEAVTVEPVEGVSCKVRLIDCVGYIIPSAVGYIENGNPRMVRTPWFDEEIPFNMAAEIGTRKVITEHSTVGIIVTTDGSITDLDREEYKECEERIIEEMKDLGKPYIMLMNTLYPYSSETASLCEKLSEEYGTAVMPINCLEMGEEDIKSVLEKLLYAFPIREINIAMPRWINSLGAGHKVKTKLFEGVKAAASKASKLSHLSELCAEISKCENVSGAGVIYIKPGEGSGAIKVELEPTLFYEILSQESGLDIKCEDDLMPTLLELVRFKEKLKAFSEALEQVEDTGYGIVMPGDEDLSLDEPEIIRQGQSFGVKLRASAPSIHLIKADICAEVAPIVGSEKQSEELIDYLMNDYEDQPEKIWETNIFGKSLSELVSEGLHSKLYRLPPDAREKLREAVERIINEGCSGLICLLL